MSANLKEDIVESIKALVQCIGENKIKSDRLKAVEIHFLDILKKSNTMYFLKVNDIEKEINAMALKFKFHSFFKHADRLLVAHQKFLKSRPKSEISSTLNISKFLLCMSTKPTDQFWQNPEHFTDLIEDVEEDCGDTLDWGAYLKEGIDDWVPECASSDDDNETLSLDEAEYEIDVSKTVKNQSSNNSIKIDEVDDRVVYDLRECRRALILKVQNGWFNGNQVVEVPPSQWEDANIGISWEKYLQDQVHNLVSLSNLNIISEYKVIREIIWQLFDTHSSVVFTLEGNKLVVRDNVTISSIRSICFYSFISGTFLPYIELMEKFRIILKFVKLDNFLIAQTYKSYLQTIADILKPIKQQIINLENEVQQQENTMTLIILSERLKYIFEPVFVLNNLHTNITKNLDSERPYLMASNLLSKLHRGLGCTVNKLEQDICLTLYIQSFYHYFCLLDSWLGRNVLIDYNNEFVIINNNYSNFDNFRNQSIPKDWQMGFTLKKNIPNDGILNIITKDVLEIGRNLHFLRLLKKYDSNVIDLGSVPLYEEFVKKILKKLYLFYNYEGDDFFNKIYNNVDDDDDDDDDDDQPLESDKSNILDEVFVDFFKENNVKKNKIKSTLYEKISKITKQFLILDNFFESVFKNIIHERYIQSGLLVKKLLIEKYKIEEVFGFLRHIFLFADDLIFPFYRRLFDQLERKSKSWGYTAWLTGHLHDTVMDIYPDFYENCLVQVRDGWMDLDEPLNCCKLINLDYFIEWPLNILIIPDDLIKYRELFQFILIVKWALHTITHLNFNDIETKKKTKQNDKHRKILQSRLKILRFNIINLLNSIHHFIFGYIYMNYLKKFELAFEKSNDLKSIRMAHHGFINSMHDTIIYRLRDSNKDGFNCVLDSVKKIKDSWSTQCSLETFERLDACYRLYKVAYKKIDPIINPVFIFDY